MSRQKKKVDAATTEKQTTELALLDEKGGIVKTEQVESASVIRLGGKDVLYFRKFGTTPEGGIEDEIFDLDGFISMTWITGYHVAVVAKGFVGPTGNWKDLVCVARQKHVVAWSEE